ncbi:hypothetical protein SBC1_69920 (plasmid) [Caballeronia sp. SBC1]|uniref:DUF4148 domain-containing protein n=1 Tax=unclassified Caballeronia TaxID=2646786 RepID=UPI0013E18CA3|nr:MULTISPECIES: DUF4148 domain-containing protein [unclassified Caballeronia]QIE28890.1 hypothetical protein SBC2_69660 [Caballeronia sp. SBC2]QIN66945.1 hypothetical protein SBC1_69920 [Caballeronia sp. SBC1]
MKTSMIALAFAGLLATGSAFAAQSAPPTQTGQTNIQVAGQWVPPYGQAVAPKTRAQVYQELVHAEQDGQLAYLNSTLYSHG